MPENLNFVLDSELPGFESLSISMGKDYEGEVFCTLVRPKLKLRPSTALLHVHGFNDYFFHAEAALFFVKHQIDYYGLDLRKSGRSWRKHQKYNNLRDVREYFDDIAKAIFLLRTQGAKFVVLMGHSMGGLVATCYCAQTEQSNLPNALFLNSPFLEQNKNLFTRKVLIPLVSRLGANHPDLLVPGGFSRFYGPSLHQSAYGEWDYNLTYKPHRSAMVNAGWVRAIFMAQQKVKGVVHISVPLIVMYPNKSVSGLGWSEKFHYGDAVVNVDHIRRLHPNIRSSSKTIVEVADAKHDLFLSVKKVREEVYTIVLNWIRSQTNPPG